MKDLGDVNHILGMRITRDCKNTLLYLSQNENVQKVVEHFNMQKGKPLSTPLLAYLKLSKEDGPKFDEKKIAMAKIPYLHLVVVSCMPWQLQNWTLHL